MEKYAQGLEDFVHYSEEVKTLHAAWVLTTRSFVEQFAYDIRVVSSTYLKEVLEHHNGLCRQLMKKLLGKDLDEEDHWSASGTTFMRRILAVVTVCIAVVAYTVLAAVFYNMDD